MFDKIFNVGPFDGPADYFIWIFWDDPDNIDPSDPHYFAKSAWIDPDAPDEPQRIPELNPLASALLLLNQ